MNRNTKSNEKNGSSSNGNNQQGGPQPFYLTPEQIEILRQIQVPVGFGSFSAIQPPVPITNVNPVSYRDATASTSTASASLDNSNRLSDPIDWYADISGVQVDQIRRYRRECPSIRGTNRYAEWLDNARRTKWISTRSSSWDDPRAVRRAPSPEPRRLVNSYADDKSRRRPSPYDRKSRASGSTGTKVPAAPPKRKKPVKTTEKLILEKAKIERHLEDVRRVEAKKERLAEKAKVVALLAKPAPLRATSTTVPCPFCGSSGWCMGLQGGRGILPCPNCKGERKRPRENPWDPAVETNVLHSVLPEEGKIWASCPRCRITHNVHGEAIVENPKFPLPKGAKYPTVNEWVSLSDIQLPLRIATKKPQEKEEEVPPIPVTQELIPEPVLMEVEEVITSAPIEAENQSSVMPTSDLQESTPVTLGPKTYSKSKSSTVKVKKPRKVLSNATPPLQSSSSESTLSTPK